MGPGAISATALIAPPAMGIGAGAGAPVFLTALMVGNGANAGNLSPFSAVGMIVHSAMEARGSAVRVEGVGRQLHRARAGGALRVVPFRRARAASARPH